MLVFGRCGEMLQKSPNQSANPSPLIRKAQSKTYPYGPLMVGGMGRAALYLKVSLGLRPDHVRWPDLHADATQPATGHLALLVLSLPFPVSPISRC